MTGSVPYWIWQSGSSPCLLMTAHVTPAKSFTWTRAAENEALGQRARKKKAIYAIAYFNQKPSQLLYIQLEGLCYHDSLIQKNAPLRCNCICPAVGSCSVRWFVSPRSSAPRRRQSGSWRWSKRCLPLCWLLVWVCLRGQTCMTICDAFIAQNPPKLSIWFDIIPCNYIVLHFLEKNHGRSKCKSLMQGCSLGLTCGCLVNSTSAK